MAVVYSAFPLFASDPIAEDLFKLDNGAVQIGIDRKKGASIAWLSWKAYPKNAVSIADPGRLIQQSYYAGDSLNRRSDGQSKSWSPWPWNPIQGGGIGSWAAATLIRREHHTMFSETIPKLWDMPNEPAKAVMRQWTSFEPSMPNVVVVRCEFVSRRDKDDRWGPPRLRPQEVPACYFTRNFSTVNSYLGDGHWRHETQPPGPPWGKAQPPRNQMAVFNTAGQGIAVFSPASQTPWNFGPHGRGSSDNPMAGPCMHLAPIVQVKLTARSTYRYRYWLVMGEQASLAIDLETLWERYSGERAEFSEP